ncbi:MAG: translation elongation factor Ts [Candidatus Marinimicrobia bacterium]|nr:translation elongation factor Ts [Candidatus Neomarinimicrobiota bacterium]
MISASVVKELRAKTGAGMMDCKRALEATHGDLDTAIDYLRKSGIAKAATKADRNANDGIVFSYIHPGSKLGVLVEVNCETDFVANTDNFQRFVKDLAMHIAATSPSVIHREEMLTEVVEREKDIFIEQTRQSGKPENILEKIVNGRMDKFYAENVLLEQAFVKDPHKSIEEYLKETISILGENIIISRFVRFQLGEESRKNGSST